MNWVLCSCGAIRPQQKSPMVQQIRAVDIGAVSGCLSMALVPFIAGEHYCSSLGTCKLMQQKSFMISKQYNPAKL